MSSADLTSKQLVGRALRGLATLRVPVGTLAVHFCAKVTGVTLREYTTNPQVLAEAVIRYYEKFRPDAVWISSDTWVSAEAMGAAVGGVDENQPFGGLGKPLVQSAADIDRIPAPNIGAQGRYPFMLEALSRVHAELGKEVFIVACFDQYPFSLASALMGIDAFMLKLNDDPQVAEALMERCLDYGLAYGTALGEAGADMLSGGDSPAGGNWKGYCAGTAYPFNSTEANPFYTNNMRAYMSHPLNLAGFAAARLSFWYKIPSIESGWDFAEVYMDGIDSVKVWSHSAPVAEWTQANIDLSAYVSGSVPIPLRFQFFSDHSNTAEGWYLDDIVVTGFHVPTNDTCPNAVVLTDGAPYTMDTIAATSNDGTPVCQANFGKGVWFTHVPIRSGPLTISTCGSSFDTVIQVFTGTCGNLTPVEGGCNDDNGPACSTAQASVVVSASAGTAYQILVGGYTGQSGTLTIVAEVEPPVAPCVEISRHDSQLQVAWNEGTLEVASELSGPWTEVPGATSPYVTLPSNAQCYFRTRNPSSVNVVGYVNTTLRAGFNLIANPLDAGYEANTIGGLLPEPLVGSVAYKFLNGQYIINPFNPLSGYWADPGMSLVPGQGVFIQLPEGATNVTITWVGEVMQGTLSIPLAAGVSWVGSMVPQTLSLDSPAVGFPVKDGDMIYRWNASGQQWEVFAYTRPAPDDPGKWLPAAPVFATGEAWAVRKGEGTDWVREFAVEEQPLTSAVPFPSGGESGGNPGTERQHGDCAAAGSGGTRTLRARGLFLLKLAACLHRLQHGTAGRIQPQWERLRGHGRCVASHGPNQQFAGDASIPGGRAGGWLPSHVQSPGGRPVVSGTG